MQERVEAGKDVAGLCKGVAACADGIDMESHGAIPALMRTLGELFRQLDKFIASVSVDDAASLVADPEIKRLIPTVRCLRAVYEFELEKADALTLLASNDPEAEIGRIIATDYAGSSLYGAALSRRFKPSPKSCLIVGSGPLPITAMMLQRAYGPILTCLDISSQGCDISRRIFQATKSAAPVDHIVADIGQWSDFSGYDIVFVNGLVGISADREGQDEKFMILEHIRANLAHDCLVILRSGYGLAQLYYPPVDLPAEKGLRCESIAPSKLGRSSIVLIDVPADQKMLNGAG